MREPDPKRQLATLWRGVHDSGKRMIEGAVMRLPAQARPYWGAEPPAAMLDKYVKRVCEVCARDFSGDVTWPIGLHRCECDGWHWVCLKCVKMRTRMLRDEPERDWRAVPEWREIENWLGLSGIVEPNRHFAACFGTLAECPDNLRVAKALMAEGS